MRQCAHTNARGAQCRRSALDASAFCGHPKHADAATLARHALERAVASEPDFLEDAAPVRLVGADRPLIAPSESTDHATPSAPPAERDRSTPAALVLDERGVRLYRADWQQLAEVAREAGGVDALIVDAPYSERTHAGHDDGTSAANRAQIGAVNRSTGQIEQGWQRRSITYAAWSPADVVVFVGEWASLTRGWFVSITDHVLAPAWEASFKAAGLYVFAPLPLYSPGSRVRLSGDGPSGWTCWIVVARPKTREFFQWGTLPGGYVCSPEAMPVVGGKPVSAMRALVRDYTRPGDLVADPCAGAGTLGVACIAEGRRALLGDVDAAHVEIAAERIRGLPAAPNKRGTLALFGNDDDSPRAGGK